MACPLTYTPWFPDAKDVIRRQWKTMIERDDSLERVLGKEPLMAKKRGKNVADRLVRAKLRDEPEPPVTAENDQPKPTFNIVPQSHKCGHTQCALCAVITESCAIRSTTTKTSHAIKKRLNCASTAVVYVITCAIPGCHKQYVGQTITTLRNRMCHERNHNPQGQWLVTPVDRELDYRTRLELESDWIRRLKTTGRFGLNSAAHGFNAGI